MQKPNKALVSTAALGIMTPAPATACLAAAVAYERILGAPMHTTHEKQGKRRGSNRLDR
jgi:hypothetical protein